MPNRKKMNKFLKGRKRGRKPAIQAVEVKSEELKAKIDEANQDTPTYKAPEQHNELEAIAVKFNIAKIDQQREQVDNGKNKEKAIKTNAAKPHSSPPYNFVKRQEALAARTARCDLVAAADPNQPYNFYKQQEALEAENAAQADDFAEAADDLGEHAAYLEDDEDDDDDDGWEDVLVVDDISTVTEQEANEHFYVSVNDYQMLRRSIAEHWRRQEAAAPFVCMCTVCQTQAAKRPRNNVHDENREAFKIFFKWDESGFK